MRFEVYEDARGEWRWRLVAANNRVIADGAEGYSGGPSGADAAVERIKLALSQIAGAPLVLKAANKSGRRRSRVGVGGSYQPAAFVGLALEALQP